MLAFLYLFLIIIFSDMFSNPGYGEVNGGELPSLQFFLRHYDCMMNIGRCMLTNAVYGV